MTNCERKGRMKLRDGGEGYKDGGDHEKATDGGRYRMGVLETYSIAGNERSCDEGVALMMRMVGGRQTTESKWGRVLTALG